MDQKLYYYYKETIIKKVIILLFIIVVLFFLDKDGKNIEQVFIKRFFIFLIGFTKLFSFS